MGGKPGNRIGELREKAGLTVGELAERSGVSEKDITEYETRPDRTAAMKLGTCLRLSNALGVRIEELLSESVADRDIFEEGYMLFTTGHCLMACKDAGKPFSGMTEGSCGRVFLAEKQLFHSCEEAMAALERYSPEVGPALRLPEKPGERYREVCEYFIQRVLTRNGAVISVRGERRYAVLPAGETNSPGKN